jgi:perosamine synthetase
MYARKRLDIGGLDLAAGLAATALAHDGALNRLQNRVEGWFSGSGEAIACLSVRSGLDNYLAELALPRGSEVLMSALTIPDMWKILEHHGLVPVPVDLDARTLAPRIDQWKKAAGPRTRLLIVAHLFGARIDLEPVLALARDRRWKVLEDCAQAFTGADYKGHPRADVCMFSFGPIKTSTALAGGVLVVRDREILARMRARQAAYPVQSQWGYFQRLLKYSCLVGLTKRPVYAAFVKGCELAGKDHDRVIQGSVRGFKGGDFFEKIRHRPSPALLAVLARRLECYDDWRVSGRVARARRLLERLPDSVAIPAADAPYHSFWVFTILCGDPAHVVTELRASGFDATQAATLSVVPAPHGREELDAREARQLLGRMVYLPVYPEMPERRIDDLAEALRRATRHEHVENVPATGMA